jgi:hypothetical protein
MAIAAAVAATLFASAAVAAGAVRNWSNVYWFSDGTVVGGASAHLVRTPNGVSMNIGTAGLETGAAYTVWWVVFNHPEFCAHGVEPVTTCGEPDLFNPEVGGAVLYAAGHIVGGTERATFAGGLRLGDLSGCQEPFAGFGACGEGLTNPEGAEIHLVIRSHDQFIPAMLPAMFQTFVGGCTPESSLGAGTGPNECEDQQFAAFVP